MKVQVTPDGVKRRRVRCVALRGAVQLAVTAPETAGAEVRVGVFAPSARACFAAAAFVWSAG